MNCHCRSLSDRIKDVIASYNKPNSCLCPPPAPQRCPCPPPAPPRCPCPPPSYPPPCPPCPSRSRPPSSCYPPPQRACCPPCCPARPSSPCPLRRYIRPAVSREVVTTSPCGRPSCPSRTAFVTKRPSRVFTSRLNLRACPSRRVTCPPPAPCAGRNYGVTPSYESPLQYLHDSPLCCPCPGGADTIKTTGLDMYNARLARTLRCPSYEHEYCPIPTSPPYQAARSSDYDRPCQCPRTNSYTSLPRYFAPSVTSSQVCESPASGRKSNFDNSSKKRVQIRHKNRRRRCDSVVTVANSLGIPSNHVSRTPRVANQNTRKYHEVETSMVVDPSGRDHIDSDYSERGGRRVPADTALKDEIWPNYDPAYVAIKQEIRKKHASGSITKKEDIWQNHATTNSVTKQDIWPKHTSANIFAKEEIWPEYESVHFTKKQENWPKLESAHISAREETWPKHETVHFTRPKRASASIGDKREIWLKQASANISTKQESWQKYESARFNTKQDNRPKDIAASISTKQESWPKHESTNFNAKQDVWSNHRASSPTVASLTPPLRQRVSAKTDVDRTTRFPAPDTVDHRVSTRRRRQDVATSLDIPVLRRHHHRDDAYQTRKESPPTPTGYQVNRLGAGEDFSARSSGIAHKSNTTSAAEGNSGPGHEGDWLKISKKYGISESSLEHSHVKAHRPHVQSFLQYSSSEEKPVRSFVTDWKTTARKYGYTDPLREYSKPSSEKHHQRQKHLPISNTKGNQGRIYTVGCKKRQERFVEATVDLPVGRNIQTVSNQGTQTECKESEHSIKRHSNTNHRDSKSLDCLEKPTKLKDIVTKDHLSNVKPPKVLEITELRKSEEIKSRSSSLKTIYVSPSYLEPTSGKRRRKTTDSGTLEVAPEVCGLEIVKAESRTSQSSQGTQFSRPDTEYLKRCKKSCRLGTEYALIPSNCDIKLRIEAEYSLSGLNLPESLNELKLTNKPNFNTFLELKPAALPPVTPAQETPQVIVTKPKQTAKTPSSPHLLLFKTKSKETAVVENCGIRLSAGADYCINPDKQRNAKCLPQMRIRTPNQCYSSPRTISKRVDSKEYCNLKSSAPKSRTVRFCVPCDEDATPLKSTNHSSPREVDRCNSRRSGSVLHHTPSTSEVLAKIVCDCGNCSASRWLPKERKLHCQYLLNSIGPCLVRNVASKPDLTYNHERVNLETKRFYPLSPHLIYTTDTTSPSSSDDKECFCNIIRRHKSTESVKLKEPTPVPVSTETSNECVELPPCFNSAENIETTTDYSRFATSLEESDESDISQESDCKQKKRKKRDFCDCGRCFEKVRPSDIPCTTYIDSLTGTVGYKDLKPAIPKVKKVEPDNLTWTEVHPRPDILVRSQDIGKRRAIPTWARKYIRYRKLLPEWVTYRPVIRYWDSALYEQPD